MELIIGLVITTLVAMVMAILINATAAGTNSNVDGRRSLVKLQSMKAKLEDQFANARNILAVGANYVVFWSGDLNGAVTPANDAVNFSELRLLEVDTSTGNLNLWSVTWPGSMSQSNIISNDTTYSTGTNWYSACQTCKTSSYFTPAVIATNCTGLSATLDSSSYSTAKMINLTITFNDGVMSRQAVMGVTMQHPMAPW